MIPVVFISDENFVMQTHVAIKSMISNKNQDTEYDVYVVMAECPEEKKDELRVLGSEQVHINFVDASLEEFHDIKQLAHIPVACLLKFKICDFVEKYDKLLYLDGDIYVRGDLSELYDIDLKDQYAAAVTSLECIYLEERRINAGIMLFNARKMREKRMAEKLISVRKSLGDRGSMDQQTFNMVLADKIGELPCEYNCVPHKLIGGEKKAFPIDKLNALYHTNYLSNKDMVDHAVIIHYATGGKPWKYTWIPCGDEWYKCYLESIYGNKKLHRETRLESHGKGFVRVLKNKGLSGIWARIKHYTVERGKVSDTMKNWG